MSFDLRNLIRCGIAIAIVALPPAAGCRNFWKADTAIAAKSAQTSLAHG
jgi:hypothetical protein